MDNGTETKVFNVLVDLPQEPINLHECEYAFANHLIRQAMDRAGGNKTQAAKLLGLNRTTLIERLRPKRPQSQ